MTAPRPARARGASACAALATLLLAGSAAADEPAPPSGSPPADTAALEAERLFEAGKRLLAGGDATAACKLFDASAQLDEAAPTLVKVARCRAREGRPAAAIDAYTRALGQRPWPELEQLIRSERREAEAQAATLLVRLVAPPEGLTLARNGRRLSPEQLRAPLFTDPGTPERFVAEAPGHRTASFEVTLTRAGETRELLVRLEPDRPPAPRPPELRVVRAVDPRRAVGYGLAGGGALALGFSAGFAVQFFALKGGVFDGCAGELPDGRHVCPAEARDRYDATVTARTWSQVLLGVGGALTATGLAIALTAPPASPAGVGAARPFALTGTVGPGALSVRGEF